MLFGNIDYLCHCWGFFLRWPFVHIYQYDTQNSRSYWLHHKILAQILLTTFWSGSYDKLARPLHMFR
jgi:hypothetical protein